MPTLKARRYRSYDGVEHFVVGSDRAMCLFGTAWRRVITPSNDAQKKSQLTLAFYSMILVDQGDLEAVRSVQLDGVSS